MKQKEHFQNDKKKWGLKGAALEAIEKVVSYKIWDSSLNGWTCRLVIHESDLNIFTDNIYNRVLTALRSYYGHCVLVDIITVEEIEQRRIASEKAKQRRIEKEQKKQKEEEAREFKEFKEANEPKECQANNPDLME